MWIERAWICCLYILTYGYICYGSVNLAFMRPAKQSTSTDYDPGNAVDANTLGTFGFIGTNGSGTCCHTRVMQSRLTPVYWEVDLGAISIITRISITYRDTYPKRFNGYLIEFSNVSLADGSVCYQDTERGNPPTFAIHECVVIGQFARYENNIGYAELCNFEAYGCPINYYGDNCTIPCPVTCLSPVCNPDNGSCIGGCPAGFKDVQCNEVCDDGTYGPDCSQQCFCRNAVCDKVTGLCPGGCQEGYSGPNCNLPCTSGRFGFDCLSQCNCYQSECFTVNGTCLSGICLPGYTLHSCSQECPSQTFGQNCSQTCGQCRGGSTCDHVTGSCENGCADGYVGMYCSITCDPGLYGFNCSRECGNCYNGTSCNHVNGHCPENKCDYGFRGMACDKQCLPKTFGLNCLQSCGNCFNDSCSVVNGTCLQGCASGYSDSLCKTSLVGGGRGRPPPSSSAVVPVIVTLCVLAAVGVGIFFFVRRKRQANNDKIRYKHPFVHLNGNSEEKDGKSTIIGSSTEALYANTLEPDSDKLLAKKSEKESFKNVAYSTADAIYSNESEDELGTNTLISVNDLAEVIESKRAKAFAKEYKELPVGLQFPHEHGNHPNNKVKNRFLSTFPYDKNRVILPVVEGVENSDYINASYIDGINSKKSYIASQGPKKGTMADFWKMVWNEKVDNIVMVTNLFEGVKTKCEKYWPDLGSSLRSGSLVITSKKETKYAAFITRELQLELADIKSDHERLIYQFHFTQWPDHGTPNPSQLVHFNSRVEQHQNDESGILLVHCSAGIGRTGTFIGLHELMKYARTNGSLDIFQYAKKMRIGRMNMIQTFEQYICLHDALLEGLTNPATTYLKEEFSKTAKALLSEELPKNETELWKQYEILKSMKPMYNEGCYTDGMSEKNIHKNRNTNIVAHNKFRTYLITYPSDSTDYINAVTIPSYKALSGYIATQIPLSSTVEDFWSMVYDHDCYCIVLLDCIPEDVLLTPPANEYMQLKSFVVYNEREFQRSEDITDIDILLSPQKGDKEQERRIKMYIANSEQNEKLPESTEVLVSLCECVIDYQRTASEDGPIVFACSNGASKCGVFAAMTTTVQRILMDKDIDIFQAIKTIQQRRTQFVDTFEQYRNVHQLVDNYIESNQLYVNI